MARNPFKDQETRSAVLLNSMASAHALDGIVSGGELTSGSGDFDVDHEASDYMIGGEDYSVDAGTVTADDADDTLRVDLIVFDDSGEADVVKGEPAPEPDDGEDEQPVAPDIPDGSVLVGAVLVPGGVTSIGTSDIWNEYKTEIQPGTDDGAVLAYQYMGL